MKTPTILAPITCAILTATSCNSHLTPSHPTPTTYNPTAAPLQSTSAKPKTSHTLIKTGSLHMQVNDVQQAATLTKNIVQKHHGYIESSDASHTKKSSAYITLRVPSDKLTSAMDSLATLGQVTSRNIKIEDITAQWIDLQAKLNNMRALRDRLRKLLNQAKNVKETLEVEKELTRIQSQLDSLEGRIKTMHRNHAHSKITLRLRPKNIPGPLGAIGKGIWWSIKKLFVIK